MGHYTFVGRGVDLSALSRAERGVLAASILIVADAFIPWWFRIRTPDRTYLHNAGLAGWSAAAVLVAFLVACAVLIRAARFPSRGPADGLAYAAGGALIVTALALDAVRVGSAWIGLYAAMVLGAALCVFGVRRRGERRSGWI